MAKSEQKKAIRWRLWMNVALGCVALAVVVYAGRKVRHFVVTDPRFTLARPAELSRGLSMAGIAHASRTRVLATFSADFGRSVFLMPIAERRRRLLAVDWVEDASIARIWPNQVAVRIQERKPVAFGPPGVGRAERERAVAAGLSSGDGQAPRGLPPGRSERTGD